jgi:hypothetical protein
MALAIRSRSSGAGHGCTTQNLHLSGLGPGSQLAGQSGAGRAERGPGMDCAAPQRDGAAGALSVLAMNVQDEDRRGENSGPPK